METNCTKMSISSRTCNGIKMCYYNLTNSNFWHVLLSGVIQRHRGRCPLVICLTVIFPLTELLLHGSLISLAPFPSFLSVFHPLLYNTPPPFPLPSIYISPLDYVNKGSFMSSVVRIFSSPRVCKEACYHQPIVVIAGFSLQSVANPSLLSSIRSWNVAALTLTAASPVQVKHQPATWDNIQFEVKVPAECLILLI